MEQDNPLSALSAAQRLRLAFIEFRVWFYGEVARKHVLERFEIATAAGTRDLMLYKQLAPNNVSYDQKHYRYLPTFSPLFQHDADKVLAALTAGVSAADTGRSSETISHADGANPYYDQCRSGITDLEDSLLPPCFVYSNCQHCTILKHNKSFHQYGCPCYVCIVCSICFHSICRILQCHGIHPQ